MLSHRDIIRALRTALKALPHADPLCDEPKKGKRR